MAIRTETIGSKAGFRGFKGGFIVLALAAVIGLAAVVGVPLVGALADRAAVTAPLHLGPNDDYGTRNRAMAPALGPNDDYGTRNRAMAPALGPNDDYGTRNRAMAPALGPNDDNGPRH
jgi:hypothetical protein